MKPNEYLKEVLKRQALDKEGDEIKAVQNERERVEEHLRNSFPDSPISIQYGGSYAKDTMIRENYDLDVICYFSHDDQAAGDNLKEIYQNVEKALAEKYSVRGKTSALCLQSKDENNKGVYFHIDVVPGRFVDEEKEDAFLYQNKGEKERLKTNIQKQIGYIKESGLTCIIRLVKYWKIREGLLDLKTFVLELLVRKLLSKSDAVNPDRALEKFWKELKENINEISIEDPANPSGNDLSGLFNDSIKLQLSARATRALERIGQDDWEAIFGPVSSDDDEGKIVALRNIRSKNPSSPKPWCNHH